MQFLNPIAGALALLGIPILVMYLIRQRTRMRPVSSLIFWEQIQPQAYHKPFWRRLRQWLSLLLQWLFLALLVLALANPLITGTGKGREAVIFVLDRSASMQAHGSEGIAWDRARELLKNRFKGLRAGQEAILMATGASPVVLQPWTDSRRMLQRTLDQCETEGTDHNLAEAIALAELLVEEREHARIVVITDAVGSNRIPIKPETPVRYELITPDTPNAGLTFAAARRSPTLPDVFHISVRAANSAHAPFSGELLTYQGDTLVDARPVSMEPGDTWERHWTERGNTTVRYRFELASEREDSLAADNTASVMVTPLQTLRVNIVRPGHPFIAAALNAIPGVAWTAVDTGETHREDYAADLTIFYQTAPTALPRSPSLLFMPPGSGFWGDYQGTISNPLAADWLRDSPLLKHTEWGTVGLLDATAYAPADGATTLVDGLEAPLVFGKWDDAGREWISTAFNLEQSDLAFRTTFPIFMGNLLQTLRQGNHIQPARLPGLAETRLAPAIGPTDQPEADYRHAATLHFPTWWWLGLAGLLWCLTEWRLFTRKITE